MSGNVYSDKKVTGKSLTAVLLVVFSLLVFTTIHTSRLSAGIGSSSSLSKTTPKQRQSTLPDLAWSKPVLDLMALVPLANGNLPPAVAKHFFSSPFFGRYFNLPPPVA